MEITKYVIQKGLKERGGPGHLRIALVADLHDSPYGAVVEALKSAQPDMIAVAGDLMCGKGHTVAEPSEQENALGFLAAAARVAPVFYSLGNHELFMRPDGSQVDLKPIDETGAVLLDDSSVVWRGIQIGGLSSPTSHVPMEDGAGDSCNPGNREPNLTWLDEFAYMDGFKILLCHQPEYYPKYLKDTAVDLVLSGHAHGGQWRFFGRGVFAPGQGWFPKLTSGVHDNRLVISRGLANTAKVPRFFNETELVIVEVE